MSFIEVESGIMSPGYLFYLRTLLGNCIEELPQDIKRTLSSFLDAVLFSNNIDQIDAKKRGIYDGLLLGSDNPSIFNDFIGVQPKGIVNENASYLIEVERTFRDSVLCFEFLQQNNDKLSKKTKDLLKRLFIAHNNDTDIEKFFDTEKLPSLIIKNIDLSFLYEPSEDVKLLLGESLIRKIKIGIPGSSNNLNLSHIRSLHIITPCYAGLHDSIDDLVQNCFGTALSSYNFIFLNNANDFLIKSFLDAINEFERRFALPDILLGLHKSLFFLKDEKLLSTTRLFAEHPEYERFSKKEYKNVLKYKSHPLSNIFILNSLLSLCLSLRKEASSSLATISKFVESVNSLHKEFESIILDDSQQMIPLHQQMEDNISKLDFAFSATSTIPYKKDRDKFFDAYNTSLSQLDFYTKKYSRTLNAIVEEHINKIPEAKLKYIKIEKRTLFPNRYAEVDQDFKDFVLSRIGDLKKLTCDVSKVGQIESAKFFFGEASRLGVDTAKVAQFVRTDLLMTTLEGKISFELMQLLDRESFSRLNTDPENQ